VGQNDQRLAKAFTRIRDAVTALPIESAVLDGEAILLRTDNTSDFEGLRSRHGQAEASLVAYDLMEANGQDIRPEPLEREQEKATPKSSLLCERESRLRSVDGKNGSVKQAEAVQRFLQQNAGKEFCHNCLARAVGFKSVHRSIIQLINNPFFARRRGRCEACASHRPKLLTRYRGKPSPHEQNGIPIREGAVVGQNEERTAARGTSAAERAHG
jgi:hypothetical protein